ncbi:hypothetical protein EJB05_56068 [Eragrostis curvula]|uniref:RING-type E3 ubiquitin transferase n=1 Tax=Eragrostis curvula TaxID=38414 RepID=A0A5J9SIB8_9POAL|nr:hypothetical protein EJB05_56068 [Eragrostis curvula]
MSNTLASTLLLLVLNYGITIAAASSDDNFFQTCPASRCSEGGPEIRFPFRLETSPPSCGAPGMELLCSEKADTILVHPNIGLCKVISIEYKYSIIDVIPMADSKCPLQNIIATNLSTKVYTPDGPDLATLVSCVREFRANNHVRFAGPISCLSNTSQLSYLVSSYQSMDILPLDCEVATNGIWIPFQFNNMDINFNEMAKGVITSGEMTLKWSVPNITDVCQDCEFGGGHCGFSTKTRQAFCKNHSSHVKLIAATSSVSTFLVLSIMVATALYLALKSKNDEETHLKWNPANCPSMARVVNMLTDNLLSLKTPPKPFVSSLGHHT